MSTETNKANVLVVLGATGHQGGSVLKYFAKQPDHGGFHLRGITRNTASEASKNLAKLGIEMIQADVADLASVQAAFAGATHIYATTDSNQPMFRALQHPELLQPGQSAPEYGAAIEKQLGENIAQAAAASASTLQRIVWSSLPSPVRWSKGKYSKVAMFDVKEEIANILQAKEELRGKLSILMIGFYAENALARPDFYAPKKQPDGVYELSLPMSGDIPIPNAEVEADAGRWVTALFKAPPGITLVGASEVLTWEQWLDLWGQHNKVPTRYVRASDKDFAAEYPGVREAVIEEFKFVEEFGFTGGNPNAILPEDLRRQGVPVEDTTILDYIQRSDWSGIL